MAQLAADGSLGNLTPDQEAKLQIAWLHLLRLCGHTIPEPRSAETPDRSKRFLEELGDKTADGFRRALWRFIVNDNPDATVLRFLRARKWDVELGMEMLVSAVNWREQTKVDTAIIRTGENVGLAASPSKTDKEFLEQYRSGKSYARHTDKENRPIYIVRAILHDPSKQGLEAMERYILHSLESLRLLARAPADKSCLIFDMGGFSLKNMDYPVVKYLSQVFEARYPETLGAVVVHNAPFIFFGIWNVVKRWIDPDVASKISFTKSNSDLLQFVPKENLQKRYGGDDEWNYQYIEPRVGENDCLDKAEKRAEVQSERDELADAFERLTLEWIVSQHQSKQSSEKETERQAVAQQLFENYWKLDPYIRARTLYHRAGTLDASTGKADFKASR